MRIGLIVPLAAAIVLAGCGTKKEATPGGEGAGATPNAANIVMPEPGEYKQTIEIIEMAIPGLPKEATEQFRSGMQKSLTSTQCLTPEESKEALKKFAEGPRKDGNCTFSKYEVGGGKLDLAMECKDKNGASSNFTFAGSFGATGSDMVMQGDQASPGLPGGKMHMKMHMVSTRIGDCPAGAK